MLEVLGDVGATADGVDGDNKLFLPTGTEDVEEEERALDTVVANGRKVGLDVPDSHTSHFFFLS